MFECRACTLRCIRAIAGDALPLQQLPRRRFLSAQTLPKPCRRAASTATAAPTTTEVDFPEDFSSSKHDALPRERQKALAGADTKSLKIELKYLRDPLKLSEHVKYTLRNENASKALDLCRLASKDTQCVVSWNAVIDWHMRRFKVNEAFKIYNEMKKRAQFPDSYTYMLILRGLSLRTHVDLPVRQENVAKAVSVHNSMSGPSAKVRPTVMHLNAALNVCALAGDMDALWAIAGQIPEKGQGAADHVTYTIILNAIRHAAYGNNATDVSVDQLAVLRQKAVNEGRRVWLDVIRKWRAGEMQIDGDLIGAMGRLLLTSKSLKDWDNVLDLIRQTTKIDRLLPPLDDPTRRTEHIPQLDDATPLPEPDDEGFTLSPAATAFKPVSALPPSTPSPQKSQPSLAYAPPTSQLLSLLIHTCQLLRTPRTATAYWTLLTSPPYSLTPDLDNFNALLRLYALNRASARAAHLLSTALPAANLTPKNSTFRIAMHVCQRDMKSPRALEHATTVIDSMEAHSADPDPQTLIEYLSLALTTNDGVKISRAIDRLDPLVHALRSRMLYGADAPKSPEADLRELKGAGNFLQALVGAIDSLLHRRLVPEEEVKGWQARRADLVQFLGRCKGNQERRAGQVEAKRGRGWRESGAGGGRVERVQGLRMSRAQWAVKQFKWGERRREGVGERRWSREEGVNPARFGGEKRLGGFGLGREE